MSGLVSFGRPWQPVVADEREAARARSEPRVSVRPPPDVPDPYAVPDLPWQPGLNMRGKRLSPREIELLTLIRDGATNNQAAHEMGCTEQTVKNHMSSIFAKLGVPDRTAAIVRAFRTGILPIGDLVTPNVLREWLGTAEQQMAELMSLLARLTAAVEAQPVESVVEPEPAIARSGVIRSGHCAAPGCRQPIAEYTGRGRPPVKCDRHIHRRAAA